jgi:acetate kinase
LSAEGVVERIGLPRGRLRARNAGNGLSVEEERVFVDHREAVRAALAAFDELDLPAPAAVGHRVVHGGLEFGAPVVVDDLVLGKLRSLIPFAPLHLPGEIQCLEAVFARFPGLPQVACFDTAFHRRMPEQARRFPLPCGLWDEGIRRYGFHGLSYEYILETLADAARGRVIIAHLGNGVSLAALLDGVPRDTTMGFTPAGGVMMGTRCGDLDPGVLLYLMREKSYGHERIDRLVNRESGLLGVSGISSDMKTLLAEMGRKPAAALAVEMFCRRLRKEIGALAAVLGGLDLLVFTGGIGERSPVVRDMVCRNLAFLGIMLHKERNEACTGVISLPESSCKVMVVPTDEDLIIARRTRDLIFPNAG